jgi:hypothetical protein
MFKKAPKKWDRDELREKAHIANLFKESLVQDFLDRTEYSLWQRWTKELNEEERETLYLQAKGLNAFRTFIEEVIVDGKMAANEIAEKNEQLLNRRQ